MNKNRIYVATFSANAPETAKKYGFGLELNDLCISENLNPEVREEILKQMKSELKEADTDNVIIHGPFTELNPSSIDGRAVELAKVRYEEAYECCRQMNVKKMVVHSGLIPLIYYPSWHIEKSVPFWKDILKNMEDDFILYIENVFDEEPYTLMKIIDEVADSRLKICLDIGHANAVTKADITVFDWIEILGKRIGHMHIHNNDGSGDTHSSLTDGNMNMKAVLDLAFEKCDENLTITIESRETVEGAAWLNNYLKEKNGGQLDE